MTQMIKRVIIIVVVGCALGSWSLRADDGVTAQQRTHILATGIFTGPDGQSHREEIELKLPPGGESTESSETAKATGAQPTTQEKPVPVEKEPYHKTVFRNRYVQVFRVRLDAGKTGLMHTHSHDDASVRLTTATVAADSPGEPIGPPEPVYPGLLSARDNEATPHTHRVHNIGTTLFDVILVQILERPPGPSTPAVSSVGVEKSKMRVYRYDIEPGITTGQHIHARPYVFAAVTDVDLATISPNGSSSRRRLKAGDIQWVDSKVTHSFANRGNAKAIIAEFELK